MILSESFAHSDGMELELIEGETLVEVLRMWDCDTQCWVADAPILIRMDSDDLAVWADRCRPLQTYVGPVRTELPVLAYSLNPRSAVDLPNPAIHWMVDKGMSSFSGARIDRAFPFFSEEHGVAIITLMLDDGWALDIYSAAN